MYNMYEYVHQSIGLCFWEIPAMLVGAMMIVMFAVHKRNQKKRENDFQDELEEKIEAIREEIADGNL